MTTTREVRPDQHGTSTGYQYGCRCAECRAAMSKAAGRTPVTDCIDARGKTSRCAEIAGSLVRADRDLERVARRANRSRAKFDEYAEELARARAARADARTQRDEHMLECPAAFVRFEKP